MNIVSLIFDLAGVGVSFSDGGACDRDNQRGSGEEGLVIFVLRC